MEQNYNNYNGYNGYNYNAYGNQENQNGNREKKPSFGVTLMKTVAIALVFGLVSGVAASTVLYFTGIPLVNFSEIEEREQEEEVQQKEQTIPGGVQQTNTEKQDLIAVTDVSDIVENAMPCVVAISNKAEITYQSFWGQTYTDESESAGTGFIVKQDAEYLYIATNNHVVEGAKELTVQFCDASTAVAEVKGTVATKDLAVIKVKNADVAKETLSVIRVATLGDSNILEVGESAIAIGNALGYGQSVTTGVISALGRSVTVADSTTGTTIVNNNLIQTDAAINPGNSGGALLNIKGEVIGINSVKYADTDVEGIGYAIPISDAMLIINKLIDGERIDETQSGYLGIQGQDSSLGAYVYYVFPGSAAEKAGIQKGDVIVEFEGTTIATMSQLKELLSYHPAGDKVDFVILRPVNNEYVEVEVTVELGDVSILPQS
ncbi:MAG: trypsin-like peptidase domain-containing protein [Agathobacter sp.]|nr:trypsin-like peptidase domain-containing protein [Agathobacter sp.]